VLTAKPTRYTCENDLDEYSTEDQFEGALHKVLGNPPGIITVERQVTPESLRLEHAAIRIKPKSRVDLSFKTTTAWPVLASFVELKVGKNGPGDMDALWDWRSGYGAIAQALSYVIEMAGPTRLDRLACSDPIEIAVITAGDESPCVGARLQCQPPRTAGEVWTCTACQWVKQREDKSGRKRAAMCLSVREHAQTVANTYMPVRGISEARPCCGALPGCRLIGTPLRRDGSKVNQGELFEIENEHDFARCETAFTSRGYLA